MKLLKRINSLPMTSFKILKTISLTLLIPILWSCTSANTSDQASGSIAEMRSEVPGDWFSQFDTRNVEIGWLEKFGDPILLDLVREAQAKNPNLQAASASITRAWALARQAGAATTPSINLSSGAQESGLIEGNASVNTNISLQANWELDLWGRIDSGRQAAIASAEAVEADFKYSQHSLAAAVARSYLISIESLLQENIARETLDSLNETLRIATLQFENGLTDAQTVEFTKIDVATAEDRLIAAQASRRDATRSLELLLGRYPAAELEVRDTLPAFPGIPPAGLPAELLERRPDLVAAERRIAASIEGLNQARAARLPQISLTGSLGSSTNDLSSILSSANSTWSLATNLLVPLIDGGVRSAQVDIAGAEQQQAINAYIDAALSAFADVETALDLGQVLMTRQTILNGAQESAEEAHRLAQLSFNAGESDIVNVLTIQARLLATQSNLLSIERQQLDQYILLNLALGGDWQAQ